jgi:hypothetical protein
MFRTESKSINTLIDLVNSSKIELPNFQRDFVWDLEKQKGLIASVFCGIPASSFLMYEGSTTYKVRDIGKNTTKYRNSINNSSQLLDGQQRLTTLYTVFNNVFTPTSHPNDYYSKIRFRWFLKIDNNISECEIDSFGLFNFKFDEIKISKELSIDQLKDLLVPIAVDEPSIGSYYTKSNDELITYCILNKFIPLFFLNNKAESKTNLRKIIDGIALNHENKIKQEINQKAVSVSCTLTTLQNTHPTINITKVTNKKKLFTVINDIADDWATALRDYLYDLLTSYQQSITYIGEINKIVEAFYVINTTGSPLTTFDLLCARINHLEIREIINQKIKDKFEILIGKNKTKVKVCPSTQFNIVDTKNGEIKKQYFQYFTQVFSLYYFLKLKGTPLEKLTADHIKAEYTLSIDSKHIVEDVIKDCCSILNKVLMYIYTNCATRSLNKITNDLALIPIFCAVIKNNNILNQQGELIKKFYFQRLLLGIYNSNQNKNCITDSKLLEAILLEQNKVKFPTIEKFNTVTRTAILRNDFLNLANLNHWDKNNLANGSGISNILFAIESFSKIGLLDFNKNSVYIEYNDKIEIHHIIPIGTLNKTYSENYDKKIRNIKHHRINSVLNKTTITKEANATIGALTVSDYKKIFNNPATFSSHLINSSFATHLTEIPTEVDNKKQTTDEVKLKQLYKKRYEEIRDSLILSLTIPTKISPKQNP